MQALIADLERWLASGERIALATVVWAEGPSPRPVGSHMVITASGQMAGSVSGGCVEGDVFREAETVLAGNRPTRLHYGVADETGWEVGLACGGTIEIYLEPLASIHERLLPALKAGETITLVTALDRARHLLVWPNGQTEGDKSLAQAAKMDLDRPAELCRLPEGDLFVQVFTPPPVLTIVGAVHLAQPLVQLAQVMGFAVRVVDGRRAFATRERFPTVEELVVAWPRKALSPAHLRPQDAIVILTHDTKFDLPALEVALQSPVGYIGLLGSQSTQAQRLAALVEKGFVESNLARIHGPVGLDLGGQEPAEIALAIMAEIVAARHARP